MKRPLIKYFCPKELKDLTEQWVAEAQTYRAHALRFFQQIEELTLRNDIKPTQIPKICDILGNKISKTFIIYKKYLNHIFP